MGLHQNGFRDNIGVFRYAGLTASNGAIPSALSINTALTGALRNLTAGEGMTDDKVGVPLGYLEGGAWVLPQKPGHLSSRLNARASITATATGLRGMLAEGAATFAITTNNPAGQLITSGAGSASFAVTTNNPLLTASVNGAGSSSFTVTPNTPILGAIADLTASAAFGITASLIRYAVGHMEGSALPYTELSPQSLAGAVVTALEATTIPVNTVAIKGQPIQGAGTEADPWGP